MAAGFRLDRTSAYSQARLKRWDDQVKVTSTGEKMEWSKRSWSSWETK